MLSGASTRPVIRFTSTAHGASRLSFGMGMPSLWISSNITDDSGVTEMALLAKNNPNRCPTHPGELLREDVLPAIGMGKSEFAEAIGISRQHLYDILNGK